MKIGLLHNPRSRRNLRGQRGLDEAAVGTPDLLRRDLEPMAALPEILADFARREVGLVVISGGDGTVQATLTALFTHSPFERMPMLAVLPRGMTNMIADDVGLKGRPGPALARLLERARAGTLERDLIARDVIRLERPGAAPLYGMFFGTAAITRAIHACRSAVHPLRIEASAAAAVTLGGLVGRWLIRRGRDDGVFSGDSVALDFGGGEQRNGCYLAVLVTTLERLILGSRPFWGDGEGELRYTSVGYPPSRFLRSLVPLLYGGTERRLPAGDYYSRKADTIALDLTCPYTLDGELFEPLPGETLRLSGGQRIGFLRL